MSQVINNLTHSQFQITEEEEEADILWNYNHIKDYRSAVTHLTHFLWLRGALPSVNSELISY